MSSLGTPESLIPFPTWNWGWSWYEHLVNNHIEQGAFTSSWFSVRHDQMCYIVSFASIA